MNRNKVEIDENTGFPLVPKTYFWRVTSRQPDYHPLRVHLRSRKLFGSFEIDWGYAQDNKESVLDTAIHIYQNVFKPVLPESELLGEYPPNKLGA